MIMRSIKIAVQRNRRHAKIKTPLECIENRLIYLFINVFQWGKYLLVQRRSSIGRPFCDPCLAEIGPENGGAIL